MVLEGPVVPRRIWMKSRTRRVTLDEAIDWADDIAKNYPAKIEDKDSVQHVVKHAQIARWLMELRERRKEGDCPPCISCRWEERCSMTYLAGASEDWNCTMYETEKD